MAGPLEEAIKMPLNEGCGIQVKRKNNKYPRRK